MIHTPLARSTDPMTSHKAVEAIRSSGTLRTQADRILQAVRQNPGLTAREYEQLTGIRDVHKRIKGLEDSGLIRRLNERKCRVSKRAARIIVPVYEMNTKVKPR